MTNRLRPNNAGISENLLHQPSLQIMLPQAMLIQQKLMKIPIPRDKKDRKGSLGFGQAKRRFFMQRGNTEPYQPTPGAFARGSALRIRRVALRIQTQSALACPRRRMTKTTPDAPRATPPPDAPKATPPPSTPDAPRATSPPARSPCPPSWRRQPTRKPSLPRTSVPRRTTAHTTPRARQAGLSRRGMYTQTNTGLQPVGSRRRRGAGSGTRGKGQDTHTQSHNVKRGYCTVL